MSANEVLNVLKCHRAVSVEHDDADDVSMTPATKVADWFIRSDDGLRCWVANAEMLNHLFDLRVSLRAWKRVLTPAREHTLAAVCEFVAKRARVPQISSRRILGFDCRTAGAFATLLSMMEDCGVDTSGVHPGTPLHVYEKDVWPKVYRDLFRIAPSLVPRTFLFFRNDLPFALTAALLLFATVPSGALIADNWLRGAPVTALTFGGFVWVWRWSERRANIPHRVEFRDLQTFADISRVLAESD